MGLFDFWKNDKKTENGPTRTNNAVNKQSASVRDNSISYEKALFYVKRSDWESQHLGRQMMIKMADKNGKCDPRVSMWMANEYEQNGCLNAAAEWYKVAFKQGVREAEAGFIRCYNPYNVDSGYNIDGTRGCGTPFLQMRERMEAQAKKDFYGAIERLKNNPSEEEVSGILGTIYQIASAHGCCVPEAQQWMGDFFETVQKDNTEAVKWFKKAADNGSAEGARCYADMVITGRGIEQNEDEAMKYYQKAADQGQIESMFVIGQYFYKNGNVEKAKAYFENAANKGFIPAREVLEKIERGEGTLGQPAYQVALDNAFVKIVLDNGLSDEGVLEFYESIYQPDDFCQNAFDYCNIQYAGKGEDKLTFEYNMTAFYGCICSVALWNKKNSEFDEVTAWNAIKKFIDVEFTDKHAEELLGTKNGEAKAEAIYELIKEFMKTSRAMMSLCKCERNVCIYAMRLAYKLGMLVAKRELRIITKCFIREVIPKPSENHEDKEADDRGSEKQEEDFYSKCVKEFHDLAMEFGVASRGVIFIPELIPIGKRIVLSLLKDSFFQKEFAHDANAYYSFIMALCIDAGIVTATKWHEDFPGLDDYVEKVIVEGPAEDADKLMKKHLPQNLFSNQGNHFFSKIYPRWASLHEPYWKLEDPRDYTFKLMLAAYQLGISVILEKYGF